MKNNNERNTNDNTPNGFSGLPSQCLRSTEELHKGKLWVFHPVAEGGRWYLAVVCANLPGVHPVKNVKFATKDSAEFAAELHNHERGFSQSECERITESARYSEFEFLTGESDAHNRNTH